MKHRHLELHRSTPWQKTVQPINVMGRSLINLSLTFLLWSVGGALAQTNSAWRFERTMGLVNTLIWNSDTSKSYDLWWSLDLRTNWIHVIGYPKDGTGGEMVCMFTPNPYQFFKIIPYDKAPDGFALIPGGSFLMGDSSSEQVGSDTELPVHTVNMKTFFMAKHEVTKALWDEVQLWGLQHGYTDLAGGSAKAADHPVHSINWFKMLKWCNARSERDGLMPCYTVAGAVYRTGETVPECNWETDGYRLPTEAEWEKAARGGMVGKIFPWGDTIEHSQANYSSYGSFSYDESPTKGNHPAYNTAPTPHTSPVGSFAPNGYGLYDMAGNVWEECWDWYGSEYYHNSPSADPRGPSTGTARVQRGGSWDYSASYCRVASRYYSGPSSQGYLSGFRLARSAINGGMVLIPEGPFQMGDQSNPKIGVANELPVHTVQLSAFYMAKYEVTKALWDEVASWGRSHGYSFSQTQGKAANHPVNLVLWFDALKWCNARSEMEGLTPCYSVRGEICRKDNLQYGENPACDWNANGYRLPTEAEWEKAARGGVVGKNFTWGDTISHSQANYKSDTNYVYDVSQTRGYHPDYANGIELYTSPVGSFSPNGYGLYDMAGNVWEWCWDWNGDYSEKTQIDPQGPIAAGYDRAIRGGCWVAAAVYCRTAEREFSSLGGASYALGFRVARSAPRIEFALIPTGTFEMGDPSSPSLSASIGWDWELPLHPVQVSAFNLSRFEVTKALWDRVRTWGITNGYTDLPAGFGKGPTHPVYSVTWEDAVKWCNARSQMDGLTPCYTLSGNVYRTGSATPDCNWNASGYRLPTEAEWERAARGGWVGKHFPWGNTITLNDANYYSDAVVSSGLDLSQTHGRNPNFEYGGTPYTVPVGSYAANDFGLCDMVGNVYEWCWDWRGDYPTGLQSDPRGPSSGSYRILRGGAWMSSAIEVRLANRMAKKPNETQDFCGFRIGRSVVP